MMDHQIGYDEAIGDDIMGDDDEMMGALLRRRGFSGRQIATVRANMQQMAVPPKPQWREGQVAPGVWGPREARELLPLTPDRNNGVFDNTNQNIQFLARPQRPFRPSRLIATVRRSAGAQAPQIRAFAIIIGTSVQQVEITDFDIEIFGGQNFGVGLALTACGPGIDIRIPCSASIVVPVGEQISVGLAFIGSSVS